MLIFKNIRIFVLKTKILMKIYLMIDHKLIGPIRKIENFRTI